MLAGLHRSRQDLARADSQNFTLIRLFGGGVGDDDTAGGGALGFNALDDHAIMQRTDFHSVSPWDLCISNYLLDQYQPLRAGDPAAALLALTLNECQ
jgi:hypothetical protein